MSSIDTLSINALRVVGAEMITKAKSGHPGIVLGAAPILHTLFTRHINIDADDDKWFNRDRFVLSAGHGSTLLYELLHLSGFDISLDDLKTFRQKGSKTPGHPEYGHVNGVEITTGPLGQGIASSVGMAIAENFLAAKFNRPNYDLVDHYTYVMCGDGDLQEGIAMEAASLAGHLNLKKLIVLYDSNDVQLDGDVDQTNTENTKLKFEAMNWNYIRVEDGNDCDAIDMAIHDAKIANKPTIIEIKTVIGYGAPNSGESSVHGKPMPEEDIKVLRKNLGYNGPELEYPAEVVEFYKNAVTERGISQATVWNQLLSDYQKDYKEDYEEFMNFMYNQFDMDEIAKDMPTYEVGSEESTRKEMGKYIDYLSTRLPNIIGGSADLSSSTMVKGADGVYGPSNPLGRNIKFGVREHAMAAIINGITLHGGLRGYCAGFFVFSDYLKPAVRLAAIMSIPSLFFFSHDTICVGEDGPTHQPVEQLTMFRSMPNTNVIRPADATEMAEAMLLSFANNTYPTVVTSSRQGLPNLASTNREGVSKGAYVVFETKKASKITLISCGSELSITLNAAKILEEKGIGCRVVSMPSMFLFDKQSNEYKEEVLPKKQLKMAIELGASMPWYKYADEVYGLDEFGASMPIKYIHETYGFTAEAISNKVLELLNK